MSLNDLNELAGIFRALALPAIGYVAYVVRDIRNELRRINGRLGRMEQWRDDHEKHDDNRFSQLEWTRRHQ